MLIAKEPVVCALWTGDILFLGAKIAVQVASLKNHQQKELEYFKSCAFFIRGLALKLAAVLAYTAAWQYPAYIKLLDGGNKTHVKFVIGVFFCFIMLYNKIRYSFRCDLYFLLILLYQKSVPFCCQDTIFMCNFYNVYKDFHRKFLWEVWDIYAR